MATEVNSRKGPVPSITGWSIFLLIILGYRNTIFGIEIPSVEPAGLGLDSGRHGATLIRGTPGILHGARTSILQDAEGQIREPHSVAAGLDYPGVGPEHAFLRDSGRVRYLGVTDREAIDAFEVLSRTEGIIPAFEPAHALGFVLKAVRSGELEKGSRVLVNLSGRGDKDLDSYFRIGDGDSR